MYINLYIIGEEIGKKLFYTSNFTKYLDGELQEITSLAKNFVESLKNKIKEMLKLIRKHFKVVGTFFHFSK